MKFPFGGRKLRQQQLEQELQTHLHMAASERMERGESEEHAQQATRREFGNVGLVREVARDQWGWRWLEEMLQDLRYGARMLRKNPGFTLVAVLTLALGIGANTAIFSVVNGVLLNPLPYPHPEQLVTVHESKPNFDKGAISYPNFLDWRASNRSFAALAVGRGWSFSMTGRGDAVQLSANFISSGYFAVLGVRPLLGREFNRDEDQLGRP